MRGRVAARPLGEVAAVAGRVFVDKGFRGAGISDVSAGLGLSHGALYTYVHSKEALLYLALLLAVEPASIDGLSLPVAAPTSEQIVALVETWADTHATLPVLAAACGRRGRPVEDELGGVVDELYSFVEYNRGLLSLVERCAQDLPELAQAYFVRRRRSLVEQLGTYLGRRIRSGHLRAVPDVAAAARFVVEAITWFAWHRVEDPDSAMLADDASRLTVRHLLLAAFLPGQAGKEAGEGA
jgi:AcrR family transcriptional regulator